MSYDAATVAVIAAILVSGQPDLHNTDAIARARQLCALAQPVAPPVDAE